MITTGNSSMNETKSVPSPSLQNIAGHRNILSSSVYSNLQKDVPIFSTPVLSQISLLPKDVIRRESALTRFLKALFVASGLYIAYLLISHGASMAIFNGSMGLPAGPRPSDGEIVNCFPNSDFQQAQFAPFGMPPQSTLSYTIPTSSDLVYFLSRGAYGHGSLQFELSDQSGGDIKVDIAMEYINQRVLQHTRVCLLQRNDGGRGIGFFTPNYSRFPTSRNMIRFDVIVRFPRSGLSNSPLVIKALETKMDVWKHTINSLEDLVSFESLSFTASNAAVTVASVSVSKGKLVTSNSPIEGVFNVSDSLILKTSNSHIESKVHMENADGREPTRLELKTSNGYIEVPITLVSTGDHTNYRSAFLVSATTSNSRLELSFPEAPTSLPFAKLDVVTRTSNSPIEVNLHPTFEGSISQRTSQINPALVEHLDTKDPSGESRVRSISKQSLGRTLTSRVWWGDDDNKESTGKIEVRTSNSPNTVRLG